MVDPADAANVTIPMFMIASKDEKKEDVEAYDKALTVPKKVVTYDEIHGFMSARADLKDPKSKAAYERGYKDVLDFIAQYA